MLLSHAVKWRRRAQTAADVYVTVVQLISPSSSMLADGPKTMWTHSSVHQVHVFIISCIQQSFCSDWLDDIIQRGRDVNVAGISPGLLVNAAPVTLHARECFRLQAADRHRTSAKSECDA